MSDPAIQVEHLHKKYARSLRYTMYYGLVDIARSTMLPASYRSPDFNLRVDEAAGQAAPVPEAPPLRASEFYALKDVSFRVQRGECVGLIGGNGAGKSTIFKVLSGILSPSHGSVTVRGRLTALIEVGSGFHPMLTGRENVYISGAVLGMSRVEIDRKFDDIIAFSGVEEFIDMPVKFYSSGMHVRLGFAVLAHLEPDIMLIDEILAVGDLSFQTRCIAKMRELFNSGTTVCLVSHSMTRIEAVSDKVIWLDHGQVRAMGKPGEVIQQYKESQERELMEKRPEGSRPAIVSSHTGIHILQARSLDEQGVERNEFAFDQPMRIEVEYDADERIESPHFGFVFYNYDTRVFEASMAIDGGAPAFIEGKGRISCLIQSRNMLPNIYQVMLHIKDQDGLVDLVPVSRIHEVRITSEGLERLPAGGPYPASRLGEACLVYQDHAWDIRGASGQDA